MEDRAPLVLVADTDPAVTYLITAVLEKNGLSSLPVSTAAEAAEQCKTHAGRLALAIVDDRFQVPGLPNIPTIVLSATHSGMGATLPKPFRLESLLDLVGKAMRVHLVKKSCLS